MTDTPARTLVTLLLDRSGSMQSVKDDTLGAINAYLEELRGASADIRFSLVQFDTAPDGRMELLKACVATPVADVAPLGAADFRPRGMTPLIDAACATIRAVAESLEARRSEAPVRTVFVIQTDGMENASCENRWPDLKALVAEKEKAGWEFLFMGCGIDAYAQGAMMGVSAEKTVSYGRDRAATRAAFAATARETSLYASGAKASMAYSAADRAASGDEALRGA